MKTKKCPKCKKPKSISEFGKNSSTKDGLQCYCKKHRKEYSKSPQIKQKSKEYQKERYKKNKDKILRKQKYYQDNNKVKIAKRKKEYYLKKKDQINKQNKEYQRNRRKIDPNFKILQNLRRRVNKVLKGNNKSKRTLELLGCTIEQLKQHLQSQFTEEMSWNNYGRGYNNKKEWHLDHRIPCASFDLSKPKKQQECFNYKNLQPLWAIDNLKKGKINYGR